MAKYAPLNVFLAGRSETELPMSFGDIEAILGARLPPVAYKHRAWWSNNPSNSAVTRAWLSADYKTERVDMGSQTLVFRRAASAGATPLGVEAAGSAFTVGGGVVARLRAALGGTVRYAPGFDPTAPTGEVWDAQQ